MTAKLHNQSHSHEEMTGISLSQMSAKESMYTRVIEASNELFYSKNRIKSCKIEKYKVVTSY